MTLEYTGRYQQAVLWAFTGNYDNEGQPLYSDPVEIDVRWEVSDAEIRGPKGTPIRLSAVVMVGQDVAIGSQLWLGKLDDLPTSPTNLHEVAQIENVPDVKGQYTQRTVMLIRKV